MRAGRAFLLMFLLPVLGVAGVAMLINVGALYSIKQQHGAGIAAQKNDLAVLNEATRISEEMAATHQRVVDALKKADAGILDESAVYRIHGAVVDTLAALSQRVTGLVQRTDAVLGKSDGTRALQSEFENYRNYVIMATDIAAVDPKIAGNHIVQARDHFVSFSQRAHQIAVQLGERVEQTGAAATAAFDAIFRQMLIVVVVGLIVMLLLSAAAARALAQRVSILADALELLAREKFEPPPLPAVERLHGKEHGEFGALAGAVLSFRQALADRHRAETDLLSHQQTLEIQVEKRTAELVVAKEAAEAANLAKSSFLANVSHELRTPLSAVIGMANLAQGISTEPKLRDYLDKIVRSGKHLNRIINELLDLSKIAAGHMELEVISFSLRTVIAHVESLMGQRAAEKGLELVVASDDAVPDVLLGDPTRLAQIFLNLIGNALKFTHAGRVAVRVRLRASEDNRVCLDIDVEDTGIGMRSEDLEQLFKPFSQADATVSRKFGGTGLGLAISQRLAEMMGGDISVTSIEGSGTTFKVRIWLGLGNAADLPPAEPAADDALPKRYQDARILVVDDQPLNREIVEALLAAVGITPRLAENGQEVLDILTESGPDAFDLVLMDIQMPVMDGLTATRALRNRAGFEKLPIIAMTAHTLAHEQELNAVAGMNDHIAKPFDNPSFYRTLAKWIPKARQKTADATNASPAKPEALPEAGNELSSLRGVDVASGLARFGGKEGRYRHWLADFMATAGGVSDQMQSEIAAGRSDNAGKIAHTFKGRVGMMGMTDLHGIVFALESALCDGTPTDELLDTLERSINEMCSELERVLKPGTTDRAPATQALESVVWSDAYSVGVAAMDAQHKKLFAMINRLAECHAARGSRSSSAFHEVLSQMYDYVQIHFKAEEDYLQKIGYPQLAEQEAEHAVFVGKMAAFSAAATEGAQDEAAVHWYLKGWLLSHILESDMRYRHFVESKV